MLRGVYIFTLFLIIVLLFFWPSNMETVNIGLIPLDSRPANTQYPQILASMSNVNIEIPWVFLDDYLKPSSQEFLWGWLRSKIEEFDMVIINTNQLFNGGLIASREPDSYENIEKKLEMLEDFCREHSEKKIIVITVLPRLLPSQFTELWNYQDDLVSYAQDVDKSALLGIEPPLPPATVPEEILQDYLNIYKSAQLITEKLIFLTKRGLIDELLIGQDDAQKYGLSNKIVREIRPYLNEHIHFVHGADELTMLVLARNIIAETLPAIEIKYANENNKGYYPFEAEKLEDVLLAKMNYINIPLKENGERDRIPKNTHFIYNDPEKIDVLQEFLTTNNDRLFSSPDIDYLGIEDIAFTNKGDTRLYEIFLDKELNRKIHGYAGWNTASNTIGTELAHYAFYQYLQKNLGKYSKEDQEKALQSYVEFKFIRVAEDLLYQGILRDKLNEELKARNIDPTNLGERKNEAEKILQGLYEEYRGELEEAFKGEYIIGKFRFKVENISSRMELPWGRTFEAKVLVNVEISG